MRGSILGLDITLAETFIKKFKIACAYSLRLQSVFRGNRDRSRVRKIKKMIREKKKKQRITEIQSYHLARIFIPQLIETCIQKHIKYELCSLFKQTINLSGIYCMVSLRKSMIPSRKITTQLCMSCKTKSIISIYDYLNRSYYNIRSPCTCIYVTSRECWQLRIYNPLTRETIKHCLSINEIKQIVSTFSMANHLRSKVMYS